MNKQLLEPVLEDGIHNIHYFNGRVLTAEDLKADGKANRLQHWQLGTAVGEGVLWGMEVSLVATGASGTPPVVSITQGLAFNRLGQALALPIDTQVTFTPQGQAMSIEAGLFADCERPAPPPGVAGIEVYVLVVSPASGFEGKAPM